jgi:hypothetical protein
MKRALASAALVLLTAGCSQSAQSTSSSPSPQVSNSLGFPLYADSTVIVARTWRQAAGSRTLQGKEVIAESTASLDQLSAWLDQISTNPPSGYSVAASGSGVDSAHRRSKALGVDFQVLTHDVDGTPRALIVVVLDPALFERKAGPVLDLIDKYSMLPQSFRDPIDQQAKERMGFTIGQVLDPSQPIGAALAAARALRDSGQRGEVLVDAAKE